MTQESFTIAKDVLKRIRHPERIPQYTFLSSTAVVACSRAANELQHFKFDSEEKQVLDQVRDIATVEAFMTQYLEEIDKKKKHNKIWKKVYTFSQFAGPVLDIFKQANFSIECSIALGLVGLLLIQPLNNKSEIEDKLEYETEQLKDIISQVKFSKSTIPTPEIESEVQGLCAAIIDFLLHALQYQKKWGIIKILGGVLSDFSKRFQSFVDKIRGHAYRIETLAQRGYTSVLLESKRTLDQTAQTIEDLRTRVTAQAAIFDIKIARLEGSLKLSLEAIEGRHRFEALKYVQELSAVLFPIPSDSELAFDFIRKQQNDLAPRERWENLVSEIQFPGWIKQESRPMLWIGGRQNRRGVSWVSSFSLDLIEALQMERRIDVAYVLCNSWPGLEVPTPLLIFKTILVQLLKAHPELVTTPGNLDLLSAQQFEQLRDSIEKAYKTLEKVLNMVDEDGGRQNREVFLIIDRVDLCFSTNNAQDKARFLKALHKLNGTFRSVHVLLTSQHPAAEAESAMGGKDQLMEVWVDTTKPLAMHSR
ncbi:hypothetical protein MMC18_002500 [Xylographa bjoerkii]|nr:hypothetical protein [Xylographa bjoerkii]